MESSDPHGLGVPGGGSGGVRDATPPSQNCHPADSSQPRESGRAAERSEGDINPLSYIKRNTICVKERWDALK